ncbi:hypothetical protein A3C25_00695 [Candidatus Roizmanbacteria bacterium RIFCSPHIGHO2_02_FULL_38_11]|uniref:Cytidyltransferase-like domain-containing protein n=1 Tax=Candidatus Roizmanbacteria bacterium RIFCSPHIGHO2_02_FULL_38_11 TaxID=1802039 RepID=A0A1F7GZ68_9BACT|nr:MAG: hypothetical protein A3C25_00695 [Candidatus Roizmanbacteria bacterium RIFCSPHIGHO2_02_FULL_38_11]
MNRFSHLVFAGTFDRLHIGHKKLLDKAFKLTEKVSIGITTEKLYKSKPLANLILTYEVRRRAVEQYIRERKWLKRARFFRLDDIYGPAVVDRTIDSILVTELTRINAEKVNKIRVENGLPSMEIIVAPLVRGDDGEVVTSERIRLGEIDRGGHNFQFSIFNFQKKALTLPRYLRKELRKPLGKLIGGAESQLEQTALKVYRYIDITIYPMVITVGDIVTMSMLRVGFDPDVKIIDLRSRRKPINSKLEYLNSKQYQNSNDKNSKRFKNLNLENLNLFRISDLGFRIYNNPPGSINLRTALIIKKAIRSYINNKNRSWIVVKGEEDLLALPAILFAPLHSVVLYGQIDLGVVMVEVTEDKKMKVREILRKFK